MSVVLEVHGFDELPDDAEGPICEQLAAAVNEHTAEWPASVSILEVFQHDEWERGDPCPECGSEKFSTIDADGHIYYAGFDELVYGENGPQLGIGPIDIECMKCNTTLYQTPAAALISGGEEDGD